MTPGLSGTYLNDYNILSAHKQVLAALSEYENTRMRELTDQVAKLEEQLSRFDPANLQARFYAKQLEQCRAEIEQLEQHTMRNAYECGVQMLLQLYEQIGGPLMKTFFGGGKKAPTTAADDPYLPFRLEIIRRFLDVAAQFVSVDVEYEASDAEQCPVCGQLMSELTDDDHGMLKCFCGYARSVTSRGYNASTLSANESMNPRGGKIEMEDSEAFVKAFNQYDGSERFVLGSEVYDLLERHFCQRGYPPADQVRSGVAVSSPEKPICYRAMFDAMTHLEKPLYAHVTSICHDFWGIAFPDTSNLRDLIMEHFVLTQRAGRELGLGDINTQYRLFKHLEMVGHRCTASDFRIPKTREILDKDEHNWKQRCLGTGDFGRSRGIVYIPGTKK